MSAVTAQKVQKCGNCSGWPDPSKPCTSICCTRYDIKIKDYLYCADWQEKEKKA